MSDGSSSQVLISGVDTFYVNYKLANEQGLVSGDCLPEPVIAQLDEWQQEARKDHLPVATSLEFSSGLGTSVQTLLMRSHGESTWSWLLFCDDLRVNLAPGTLNRGLFCQARFSSHLLWTVEPEKATSQLEQMLVVFLGHAFFYKQASEIHLCADVIGFDFSCLALVGSQLPFVSRVVRTSDRPVPPTQEEQDGGLTPKRIEVLEEKIEAETEEYQENFHLVGLTTLHRRIATLDFGTHASPISAQIYNKSLEIKKHHKEWFEDIWRAHGWDGQSTSWRVEFRFKRAFLRKFELDEAGSVLARLLYLWVYATEEWLRFVDLTEVKGINVSRRPTHPVWCVVQRAFDGFLQCASYDESGEQAVRLAHVLEMNPLKLLQQTVAVLAESAFEALSDDGESEEQYEKERQRQVMREFSGAFEILHDAPREVVQALAEEYVAQLTLDELTRILDHLESAPMQQVLGELVARRRRQARVRACVAAGTGYIRTAIALADPDEFAQMRPVGPGASASAYLPDRVALFFWFAGRSLTYDKEKGRSHVEEVLKRKLVYGFLTAAQLEIERRHYGVELLPEDFGAIDEVVQRLKQKHVFKEKGETE